MLYLLQQINLYRELLAQVAYQNQLLGSNVSLNQGVNGDDGNLQHNSIQHEKIVGGRGFQLTEPK
jgi:hypothetical protein